jgi:hypothetical protein
MDRLVEKIEEQDLTFEEAFQLISKLATRFGVAISVDEAQAAPNTPNGHHTPTRPKQSAPGRSKPTSLRAVRGVSSTGKGANEEGLVGRGKPAQLSECWLEHQQRAFMDMDQDGDCRLDAGELHVALIRMGHDDISPESVQLMMAEADKDNDGSIDLHEFLEYFCKIVTGDNSGSAGTSSADGQTGTVLQHADQMVDRMRWELEMLGQTEGMVTASVAELEQIHTTLAVLSSDQNQLRLLKSSKLNNNIMNYLSGFNSAGSQGINAPSKKSMTLKNLSKAVENNVGFAKQVRRTTARPSARKSSAGVGAAMALEIADVPAAKVPAAKRFLLGLDQWTFNIFDVQDQGLADSTLVLVGMQLIFRHQLHVTFGFDDDMLKSFLEQISGGYKASTPYHNEMHAADAAQTLHYFLTRGDFAINAKLRPATIFAALFAALVHDFGHPGFNNGYLVASGHDWALR